MGFCNLVANLVASSYHETASCDSLNSDYTKNPITG